MKKYAAEYIGTFALVFAGTGAIVVNTEFNGVITHPGIAATFGLVVMAMIYAFGRVSGAHFNPAVTLGFYLARQVRVNEAGFYVLAQVTGAITASLLLALMFPANEGLGVTASTSTAVGLVFEVVLTFFLMMVILSVTTGASTPGHMAGLAIGATVGLCALFGGPASGASMNPARSIGPALASGNFDQLWIYILAPAMGASLAVVACKATHREECCKAC